jgi:hypothetical protein
MFQLAKPGNFDGAHEPAIERLWMLGLQKCRMSQPHFGAKCENATHTPESGKMESSGTPKNSELDLRGQISSHWNVLGFIGKS